jgi:hypothetical protein
MYTHLVGSIFLGALVAITGCNKDTTNNNTGGGGGAGGGGSGGGTGDLTLDEFAKKIISLRCANAVECHRDDTVAECEATTLSTIERIQQYLDDGSIVYHPEKAAACLDAFKKTTGCSYSAIMDPVVQNEVISACGSVFEGIVADGGNCFDDGQCISRRCSTDPNCSMQCCPGTCAMTQAAKPIAKIGESCTTATCENGAYCQSDMMGGPMTCVAQLTTGQACTDFKQCEAPAFCDLDLSTGMGVCTLPAVHGATCKPKSFVPCDRSDDVCEAATLKCVTKALIGALCMNLTCVDYAKCDTTTKKCVKISAEGDACDVAFDLCLNDLACLDTSQCGFPMPMICK